MNPILASYLLFLGKTATVVVGILVIIAAAARRRGRRRDEDRIEVKDLKQRYRRMADALQIGGLPHARAKKEIKRLRRRRKREAKAPGDGRRIFVVDFHGDLKASAVTCLREEVTAILMTATPQDEVMLRLESSGGVVHGYGLAAAQLQRLTARGIPLTVAVDKVAASGGYMMACIANRLIAAPFAIVGSIGVIAQIPNFNRLLKRNNIEYEQMTAGAYKRTLTVFGENTDTGRRKLQEELEDTHRLFKDLIHQYRAAVDIERVATGEHWYGAQAVELKLVDELQTSDDYLLAAADEAQIYHVAYVVKKGLGGRLSGLLPRGLQRAWYGQG